MNRRTKAIFYATLGMIGFVGASASAGTNRQTPIYRYLGTDRYERLDPAGQGIFWDCEPSSGT